MPRPTDGRGRRPAVFGAALCALMSVTLPATAAVLDFAAISNATRTDLAPFGVEKTWSAAFPDGLAADGLIVRATGSNSAGSMPWVDAFLDSEDATGPAGLGVCSTPLGCATGGPGNSRDDNVSAVRGGVETLSLAFDRLVDIDSLFFRNVRHKKAFGTLLIDGEEKTVEAGRLVGGTDYLGFVREIDFTYGGANATQFYLSTATVTPAPVPVPAAALLLVSGLAGMGLVCRRRRPAV